MTNDEVTAAVREIPENIATQVAVNTTRLEAVIEDIHEIRDDMKGLRKESREDARSTRQALFAFAVTISVPLLGAAAKLLFS